MEFTCNECEPASQDDAPHDVTYEAGGYRRRDKKTPNRYVETTFGRIELWRRGYRYWHRDQKAPTIFPVELILGLVKGATPLLAGELSRLMGDGGATQPRVLEQALATVQCVPQCRALTGNRGRRVGIHGTIP